MKIKEKFIWEYQRYYFVDYKIIYFNNYESYVIENNKFEENEIKFWSSYFKYIFGLSIQKFHISLSCMPMHREERSEYLTYMFLVSFAYINYKDKVDDDEYNYYHSAYHDYNNRGLNW